MCVGALAFLFASNVLYVLVHKHDVLHTTIY